MQFAMKILAIHANGHLVAWHEHLIGKVHFQLWTIVDPYATHNGQSLFTETTEYSSRSLTSHFQGKEGRVVCCCLLCTAYDVIFATIDRLYC